MTESYFANRIHTKAFHIQRKWTFIQLFYFFSVCSFSASRRFCDDSWTVLFYSWLEVAHTSSSALGVNSGTWSPHPLPAFTINTHWPNWGSFICFLILMPVNFCSGLFPQQSHNKGSWQGKQQRCLLTVLGSGFSVSLRETLQLQGGGESMRWGQLAQHTYVLLHFFHFSVSALLSL